MTKDEVIAWFRTTNDLSPMVASMQPATESASRPAPDVSMMLAKHPATRVRMYRVMLRSS